MNAPMMFGAKAYAQVGLESGVNSASPHKLIVMLYDGAIESIRKAKMYTEAEDTVEKVKAIDKAMRIISDGLIVSLDVKSGGQLAEQLLSLYQFVIRELVLANAKNDPAKMDDCIRLLADLRSAWNDIGSQPPSSGGSNSVKGSL
ncbi:MAG: flagellar export chaperone FliS [Limnobacter sp.]|nr:flagellar export chaperone FliS [Limnobacter sp.]